MGDSDDDFGSSSNNNGGSGSAVMSSSNNINNNSNGNGNNNNNNKRNRDKFYRERDDSNNINSSNNGSNGNNNNNNNNRRDWNDRSRSNDSWKNNRGGNTNYNNNYQRNMTPGSGDYPRKYQGGGNNYGSGGGYGNDSTNPPMYKKNRKDWDGGDNMYNSGGGGGNYGNYGSMGNQPSSNYATGVGGGNQYSSNSNNNNANNSDYPTQPPLLSFKMFLQQQDDGISDDEAIRHYNEYKLEFKRTQINNFFLEHKEEEWFKSRYYPDESVKRRTEQNQCVLNRLEAFMYLLNDGWLENVSAQVDRSKEIIRFLDAVVVKLEGGNEDDLKQLDAAATSTSSTEAVVPKVQPTDSEAAVAASSKSETGNTASNSGDVPADGKKQSSSTNESKKEENGDNSKSAAAKRKPADDSGSESGAYSDDSDNDDTEKSHKRKKLNTKTESSSNAASSGGSGSINLRQLHRTASIFMRSLAPSVSKQDLEALCQTHEGFKRVALSDPAPDRGFLRRGWITFDSNVDVKKICWSLQNIKIRGINPGAIVNRELSNRVRPIPSLLSHHKSVVKNDIKLAMKIIQNMDKRWNLWQEVGNEKQAAAAEEAEVKEVVEKEKDPSEKDRDEEKDGGGGSESNSGVNPEDAVFNKSSFDSLKFLKHKFNGPNPLLEKVTDYLVDEIDAEEAELLGSGVVETGGGEDSIISSKPTSKSTGGSPFDIEIDRDFNKFLDKLILYLRVVHSIDFYNSLEYQQEDSMPNRCGIIFVRPALPPDNAASASLKITQDEVNAYIQQFEAKMKPYVDYKERVEPDVAKKLGLKEVRDEVEKFIKVNTEELAPDRWLCPLSGKKFKGPEFIRKHLFYKHIDKINEVKKEVEFFNMYLLDPKRPQLPEHPSNRAGGAAQQSLNQQSGGGGHHHQHQHMNFNNSPMPHSMNNNMSNISPGMNMGGMSMMGGQQQMSPAFGMMPNNRPGGWHQQQSAGFMGQHMAQGNNFNNFMPHFSGGGGMPMQYQGGFKKNDGGGYGRRGPREMIQYKDLDAPDDN